MSDKKKLTAVERLGQLEGAVGIMDQAIGNLAQNVETIADQNQKNKDNIEALVWILSQGMAVSETTITQAKTALGIAKLDSKIKSFLDQKLITPGEALGENSIVVGRELDAKTGEVVNPRLQFMVSSLTENNKPKFLGKKPGDTVLPEESSDLVFEIEQVYDLILKTEETETQTSEAQPEAAPEQSTQA